MKDQHAYIEDQLLVMDAQDGSGKAMDKLVSRWQRQFWSHAYRLTSDEQAAWDVTQQSWIAIIKGLPRLNDPANFNAWSYRIVTNKSIDWLRRNRLVKHTRIEDIAEPACKEEKDICIKELLEKLDVKKRAAVCLYYFEQLSIPEVAASLNISVGTVKSRLYAARNELKGLWLKQAE